MMPSPPLFTTAASLLSLLFFTACSTPSTGGGDMTSNDNWEGLTRVKSQTADEVWVLPDVDFSPYRRIAIEQPDIAFRRHWQREQNSAYALNRLSDRDVQELIHRGQDLLLEAFIPALREAGFEIVSDVGPDVLVVHPAIRDLDLLAPNPDEVGVGWNKVYTDGTGSATMVIELYDSVSNQLLARAIDSKDGRGRGFAWRMPRTNAMNVADARAAFADWAEMLVRGLQRAQATPTDT